MEGIAPFPLIMVLQGPDQKSFEWKKRVISDVGHVRPTTTTTHGPLPDFDLSQCMHCELSLWLRSSVCMPLPKVRKVSRQGTAAAGPARSCAIVACTLLAGDQIAGKAAQLMSCE